MTFKTQYNYELEERVNSQSPSLTVPGQSASIRELYARAMRGEPIIHNNKLQYTGDELVPDFDHMDPVDRDNYIESLVELKQQIDENNKLNAEQKAAEKEKTEAAMYQKWADKYAQQNTTKNANIAPGQNAGSDASDEGAS